MREISQRMIKQVKKGNGHAFKKIVEHYHQPLYHICYIMSGDEIFAEKLANDTFLYVYSHIDKYEVTDGKFSLWLLQKAVCLARQDWMEGDSVKELTSQKCPQEIISSFLMNLTVKERLALFLKTCNYFSVQEIGEVLEIPKTEILPYIWQGRETLREKIRKYSV